MIRYIVSNIFICAVSEMLSLWKRVATSWSVSCLQLDTPETRRAYVESCNLESNGRMC